MIEKFSEYISSLIKTLPETPGVYQYYDDENNLLKLEQFNTSIAYPRLDDPFNRGCVAIDNATRIYDDSIPDILNDTRAVVLTHYDDSIPDILNNVQYSIPENFVRLAYS